MAFPPKKQVLPAVGNMPALVPGVVAVTVSDAGRTKANLENIGAGGAGDPAMQFNISENIGA